MKLQVAMLVLAALAFTASVLGDDLVMPCASQTDCADIADATCSLPAGRCVCPNGFVLNGDMTRCLAVSNGFGAACEDNAQCAVRLLTGAFCTDKAKCECTDGYHYLHGRCWKSLGLGESCSNSAQCYANFNHEALTCAAGSCTCSDGFYLHAGDTYCRRLGEAPGDECFFDFDCQFEGNPTCREDDKICVAAQDTEADRIFKKSHYHTESSLLIEAVASPYAAAAAQPATRVGEACAGDDECRAADPNAECSSAGSCWCARGFYDKSGACLRELGEPCELETDCTHIANGTCRALPAGGAICSCNVYSIPGNNNQRCNRLRPELEFNCQSQLETCQNFGPLCNCVTISDVDIKCRCDNSSHFEEEPQTCWLTKNLGESCSAQEDCFVASGKDRVYCTADTTCQCVDSYHHNKGDCLKDSLVFGEECTDDIDCLFPNAACGNSSCICKSGYFPSNIDDGAITCLTGIGGECSGEDDCRLVENSMCNTTASQCVCSDDPANPLVASEKRDRCLPVALAYGDACTEDVQCQAMFGPDINCTDDSCMCREQFHFLDQENICWEKKELHERCYSGRDCFVASGSERTDCVNGLCKCQYQFVEDVDAKDCRSGANELVGALASLVACLLLGSIL